MLSQLLKYSKHIFTIILLFFFVFGVSFSFLPVNTSKLVLLFLMGTFMLYFFSKNDNNIQINRDIYYIFSYSILLLFISLLYPVFHQTNDFAIPYAYFILILEAMLGSYLLFKFYLYRYSFEEILNLFIWIALIQSIIIIGMLLFEPFRDFINSITNKDITDLVERYGGFRGFGLASSVTYDLAVFLSIPMMFITYLISIKKDKRSFYIFSWLIMFIAVAMTGRSGWIGVTLSLGILFYFSKNKNSLKNIGVLLVSIILAIMTIVFILSNYYPLVYKTLILKIVPYAFEMFINLYNGGSMITDSSEVLRHMYFPISEKTFFFGDGYWANPNGVGYYMGTDAGYMRNILFYGILPSTMLYLFYLFIFFKLYIYGKKYKNSWLLIVFLGGYYFLIQYKGSFLLGSAMNIKLLFILLIYLILSNTKKRKYNA